MIATKSRTRWAHPRSRGENVLGWGQTKPTRGSSPLTRGKLVRGRPGLPACGLIPTHAGKTAVHRTIDSGLGAHPHSRRENSLTALIVIVPPGSSPLTRGKGERARLLTRPGGLIPARAGKTGQSGRRPPRCAAHPRSRGENNRGDVELTEKLGSSPLTRGKLRRRQMARHLVGLIPAHAGKTAR